MDGTGVTETAGGETGWRRNGSAERRGMLTGVSGFEGKSFCYLLFFNSVVMSFRRICLLLGTDLCGVSFHFYFFFSVFVRLLLRGGLFY